MQDEIIGTRKAGKLLNVNESTVRRWCTSGKLKASKTYVPLFNKEFWSIKKADVLSLRQDAPQQEDQPS